MDFSFIFPGQGSQSVDMLSELATKYKQVRQTFKEASDVLSRNLWRLVNNGSEEELNLTTNAQPILLTTSIAMWRIWSNSSDRLPKILAGHSLGEYSALVCGGAIKFHDALKLVHIRAELMQNAVPAGTGKMAAIMGLNSKEVISLCKKVDAYVAAVNFNSSKQIVVAGEKVAVNQLIKLAQKAGAYKCVLLTVSIPSHCALMHEAADKFSEYVNEVPVVMPKIPIVCNIDATIKNTINEIRQALIEQIYSPVQWFKTIQYIGGEGIEYFVEAGPGRVLSGLLHRIDRNFKTFSLRDSASFEKALEAIDGWDEN